MRRATLPNPRRRVDPVRSEARPGPSPEPSSAPVDEPAEARKLVEEVGPEAALPRLKAQIESRLRPQAIYELGP